MIIGSQPLRNLALVTATALLSLLPVTSAHPQDTQNSFVEFKDKKQTDTFDLRTVEVIQPGKFLIVETFVSNADVMKFELKVLDTLRSHCARQVGSYPAPAEVFTLGPPDMPVKEIEVKLLPPSLPGSDHRTKIASWRLPYTKMMVGTSITGSAQFTCNLRNEAQEYLENRNLILHGITRKVLFDCSRGLRGDFYGKENDYRKVQVYPVRNGTVGAEYFIGVCKTVTGKDPYFSE